ncbi:MAG: 5'-3' exonuclease H3TH domain-containing protein [Candidatus Dojkabacteria bacterium]|nr:MAG: 5'-3' exonuclease H3TH domain-containing protein [Candidatus Dojkabacteria bacterium]
MAKTPTVLAIDANAIVHRAFHAFPPNLTTTTGLQVNAVYGFTAMLLSVLEQFEPEYIFCAFDTPKPTFRHTKYVEYKAQRKPVDKSLTDQFPVVEEVLNAFNIPIIKKDGFEADDILGTVAKWVDSGKWQDYGVELVIVSGDRDLLQLITPKVRIALPAGSFKNLLLYDAETTYKRYGYYPEQVIDYKAIVGDASDNIPGIKGIGDKSALEMLGLYKSLEGIYENIDKLKPRQQKLLAEGVEQAQFSRELATIDQAVDLDLTLEASTLRDFNREEVISLFGRLEFRSLVNKIPQSSRTDEGGDQLGIFGETKSSGESKESSEATESLSDEFNEIHEVNEDELVKKVDEAAQVYLLALSGKWVVATVDKSGELSGLILEGEGRETLLSDLMRKLVVTPCETIIHNSEALFAVQGADVDFDSVSCSFIDLKLAAFHMSSGLRDYSLTSLIFNEVGKNLHEEVNNFQDAVRLVYYSKKLARSLQRKDG